MATHCILLRWGLIITDYSSRNGWPIYLVGCHRSGTTLLRFILDTHAHISCPPETKFVSALWEFLKYPQVLPAVRSLGISDDELTTEIGDFVRRLMCRHAEGHGKRRWADKTPNYYRLLPFIYKMFEGRVLFLFVTRHPFDTAISLNEMIGVFEPTGQYKDPELSSVISRHGIGLYGCLQYWTDVYETIGTFAVMHPEECLTIRYEDLVTDPVRTCNDLFAFVGESFVPELLDNVFVQPHTRAFGDVKILAEEVIHRRSIDRWREWNSAQIDYLWGFVSHAASRYGYRPNPSLGPARDMVEPKV
jgi:protein-tyrosine sulfotransferase